MKNKFGIHFQTLILENIPFEKQIQFFNNAKIIVCAHGACMSNLFFCKKDTILFEVTCDKVWPFFDTITKNLQIIHHKIEDNNSNVIINRILNENISLSKKEDIVEELNPLLGKSIPNNSLPNNSLPNNILPNNSLPNKNIPNKNLQIIKKNKILQIIKKNNFFPKKLINYPQQFLYNNSLYSRIYDGYL